MAWGASRARRRQHAYARQPEGMGVAQGQGQGVGLVFTWCGVQCEQEADHVLDLGLLRRPGPHHRLFDGLGAVLVDLDPTLEGGTDDGPACLPELEGGDGSRAKMSCSTAILSGA